MSFALEEMLQCDLPVARVVVAASKGSVPREIGASMLVGPDHISGTIGGGALEFEAIQRARQVLLSGQDRFDRMPLGPGLGQCCGGAVSLLTEVWDEARLSRIEDVCARPLPGHDGPMPLAVRRCIGKARSEGARAEPKIMDGWMVEPVKRPTRDVWVWGAGHVGRALVDVLAPMPGLEICWVDTDQARFPEHVPDGVRTLVAANPSDLVTVSTGNAEHFVLTFSHAFDLEICHRVLSQPFRSLGLIGSATKRARFRKRLAVLGHSQAQIDRMRCPIGDPALGKHPQAIALGVAADILRKTPAEIGLEGQSA